MKHVEKTYQLIAGTEKTNLEGLKDISSLLEKDDFISESIAVSKTEKLLGGYQLVNKGVAKMFAKAFKKVYDDYGEESVTIIKECMFERIGEKNYAVGNNTFLSRLKERIGDYE